ncbi:MAG TPA: TIGR03936 family radical SAM-associated protein, partial [Patescibacteria group bacterium]|nr:TIGR03936 family radical SAM-associated protein [Patescibacteria group bacterium]
LPVGVEGRQELADIELRAAMAPEELVARVNRCLAAELQLLRAWEVPSTAPSLTTSVREAVYRVLLPLNGCAQEIGERLRAQALCDEWLNQPSIPVSVERKEKRVEVDARPQIRELVVLGEEEGALCWDIRLSAGQGGGVRPHVIMAHLLKETLNGRYDGWETKLRVARTALILDGDQ